MTLCTVTGKDIKYGDIFLKGALGTHRDTLNYDIDPESIKQKCHVLCTILTNMNNQGGKQLWVKNWCQIR